MVSWAGRVSGAERKQVTMEVNLETHEWSQERADSSVVRVH